MIETRGAMFSPSSAGASSAATPNNEKKANGGITMSASSAAVEEEEVDSPLVALDKLVASATAGAAGRLVAADSPLRGCGMITATGSDENSGNVGNRQGAAAAAASSAPSAGAQSPSTPASASRRQHTGSYANAAENGISTHPSHHQPPQSAALGGGGGGGASHGGPGISGKPPTAVPRNNKGKSSSATAAAGGGGANGVRSDWSADPPATVAATLSSSCSSSPGQMSRSDGSGGGGVAAELAALNGGGAGAAAAAAAKPPRGRDAPSTPGSAAAPQSSGAAAAMAGAGAASPGGVGDPSANGGNNSNAFLVPRNPRDTVPASASSPKRRTRLASSPAAAASAPASAAVAASGGRSVGATSHASAVSSSSAAAAQSPSPAQAPPPPPAAGGISPTRSQASSSYAQSSYAQLSLPSSPQGSGAGVAYLVDTSGTALGAGHASASAAARSSASASASAASASASAAHRSVPAGGADIVRRSDPDAEEQVMFEQRLCEDEYGVAVRKINSNGRSQLRYVKCVPLTAHPRGDGGFVPGSPNPGERGHGAGASVASASRSVSSSAARSVSSLMGRISRSGRSARRSGDRSRSGRDRSVSVERRSRAVEIDAGAGHHSVVADSPSQASGAYGAPSVDDPEQMRNLLATAPGRRRLALTWGNKKKVKLGLDRFVCVRKGKTTERTRRNPCHPSRLLSLVTDDRANPSLDIEAPTKLDRDKFARAFARFLGVPLEADGTGADELSGVGAGTSVDLEGKKRSSSRLRKERFSAAHSAPDLSPSVKSIRSASTGLSQASSSTAPRTPQGSVNAGLLPAMTQSPSASEDLKLTFDQDLPVDPFKGGGVGVGGGVISPTMSGSLVSASQTTLSSSNVELLSDVPVKNLLGRGRGGAVGDEDEEEPDLLNGGGGGGGAKKDQGTARKSAAGASSAVPSTNTLNNSTRNSMDPVGPDGRHRHHHHHHHHHHPHHSAKPGGGGGGGDGAKGEAGGDEGGGEDGDANTDVSSLTQGFDQEIVEELHQALTELRAELEASRAEAARAVKVAEQAIQSAESCTSNDWNSTVTHKAAEAAAKAQKRSAEAMAKQREAEERLAKERKSAQFWRKQAEESEEEKGGLRTRAAAAEVQRTAMASELRGERQRAREDASRLREERVRIERVRAEELARAAERNRLLEIELDKSRRDLAARSKEAKSLHETLTEIKNNPTVMEKSGHRKKLSFGRSSHKKKHQRGQSLLASDGDSVHLQSPPRPASAVGVPGNGGAAAGGPVHAQSLVKVHADASRLRTELDILRRTAAEEIAALPEEGREWAGRAAAAAGASRAEAGVLRERLARETAMRRKLSDEVQDLRGSVRVFCRPRSSSSGGKGAAAREATASSPVVDGKILSVMSHDILQMRRDRGSVPSGDGGDAELPQPLSFEFDHIFASDSTQKDVYAEVEKLVLSAMDGYNICIMAYGPRGCGKTHTLVGDFSVSLGGGEGSDAAAAIEEYGIHFLTAAQLFSIAEHRQDRYQDSVTINIVEVHNERLRDLLAGTSIAEACGETQGGDVLPDRKKGGKGGQKAQSEEDANTNSNSSQQGNSTGSKSGNKHGKLEIRTTYDGDTVVQGLISVPVKSFDDICRVWQECLIERAARLAERGIDAAEYEAESHVITTLNVVSTNTATGVGTVGKIQFADLASSDLVPKRTPNGPGSKSASSARQTPMESVLSGVGNDGTEWKFANRSLGTLLDVVSARCQFSRSVPYRNSTITHLLRDSLTSDTKVLLMVCVSDEAEDLQETASSLRFASQMRRIAIGKATKHTVSVA